MTRPETIRYSFDRTYRAIRARDFLRDVFHAIAAAANRARGPSKLPFSPNRAAGPIAEFLS